MEDFYVPPGWISLARAIAEIVGPVAGDDAWEQIKTNIAARNLDALCKSSGETIKFNPLWLRFVVKFEEGVSGPAITRESLAARCGADAVPQLFKTQTVPLYDRKTFYFDQNKARRAGIAVEDVPPWCVSDVILPHQGCLRLWPTCEQASNANNDPLRVVTQSADTKPLILKRKRGPDPVQREAAKDALRGAVADGRYTKRELAEAKPNSLALEFGFNRSTMKRARDNLCSDCSS